jgi:hypothetical protein
MWPGYVTRMLNSTDPPDIQNNFEGKTEFIDKDSCDILKDAKPQTSNISAVRLASTESQGRSDAETLSDEDSQAVGNYFPRQETYQPRWSMFTFTARLRSLLEPRVAESRARVRWKCVSTFQCLMCFFDLLVEMWQVTL